MRCPLRTDVTVLVLLLACTPTAIKLEGTTTGGGEDTAGGDTATTTTTDSTTQLADAGNYVGTIDGLVTYNGRQGSGQANCSGDVTFTLDESGGVTGTIQCEVPEWRFTYEGDAVGTYADGAVEGTWTVDFGYNGTYDIPIEGTVAGGVLELAAAVDWGGGNTFEGDISADN